MKNTDPCREAPVKKHEPLALDLLLTKDQRRTVTPEVHQAFRESISSEVRTFDMIDAELDDMIDAPWPELNPPSRRKDSEVNRVLSILDNLPTGKDEA